MPTNTVACASQWRTGYACEFCLAYAEKYGYSIARDVPVWNRYRGTPALNPSNFGLLKSPSSGDPTTGHTFTEQCLK